MKILKFGGTSVGKPERMHAVAELITRDDEDKIVVLSAVSGTTNSLVEIGDYLYKKDKNKAAEKIKSLKESYGPFVEALYSSAEGKSNGTKVVETQFSIIEEMLEKSFTDVEERLLLAQGELISTQLFYHYLQETQVDSSLLMALDFMSIDENDEPDMPSISAKLKKVMETQAAKINITQGFICTNEKGEVDNLKRGGSDYTASLIGAAILADEVQIWTDIDGMHNNDPRVVDNTYPIAELSFDEAAELAYFGAKILHPFTVRPAMNKNIPVKLLNTMEPQAAGTTISNKTHVDGIKAIAAKDNITAIKIKSTRMLLAYGFLRKVFEIFEKYRTSIDMITTSEVAVSLTIDNDTHLDAIIKELEAFCIVEVDKEQSIVCMVGHNITQVRGTIKKVINSLDGVGIRMISYGGSKNNISLLVRMSDKNKALKLLNEGLFK